MECLIATIGRSRGCGAGSISIQEIHFRIYRHTLQQQQDAIKTNIAAYFQPRGRRVRPNSCIWHRPREIFSAAGCICLPGIVSIRRTIVEHPDEYLALVEDPAFRKMFGEVMGDKLRNR
jgi:hypothetical protein